MANSGIFSKFGGKSGSIDVLLENSGFPVKMQNIPRIVVQMQAKLIRKFKKLDVSHSLSSAWIKLKKFVKIILFLKNTPGNPGKFRVEMFKSCFTILVSP